MRSVPPLASDGLYDRLDAGVEAAAPAAAAAAEPLLGCVEPPPPPPHAASPRAATAARPSPPTFAFFSFGSSHLADGVPGGTGWCAPDGSAGRGVEGVAQAVAEQVEGQHGDEDRQARERT